MTEASTGTTPPTEAVPEPAGTVATAALPAATTGVDVPGVEDPAAATPAAAAPPGTLTGQWWLAPPGSLPPPPPLPPGFLKTRWPAPGQSHGLTVPVSVLVAGLGFAVFIPLSRTGIGWFLGGLVAVIAIAIGARAARTGAPAAPAADPAAEVASPSRPGSSFGERAMRVVWSVSALALLSVLAFRNAWWLVTFCVLGALGCAALAIVGGRSTRSILFSLGAAPFAALRGLPWVARHFDAPAATSDTATTGTPRGTGRRVLWSLCVTALVLLIFGALFSSADAAFSQVLGDLIPEIDGGRVSVWVFLLGFGLLLAVAAVFTLAAPPDLSTMDKPGKQRLGRIEWALPVGAMIVLFGGFVVIQITVLFGGARHVLDTAGLSYAEYARSGFWQLVTVTILTLVILSGVTRWSVQATTTDRLVLRIMLGLLSILGMVVVASALFRMYTYQQVYSFTGERIFVMGFELLLGAVFVMILLAGIRWRGAWIPRLVVGLGVILLLTLAVLNPEDYAARRNIQRYNESHKIDLWYLRALSADATPALSTLSGDLRQCTLMWIVPKLADPDPWYGWNLGREQARKALAEAGPTPNLTCANAGQYDFPNGR